jgi:hypothetical protein
MDMGRSNAVLAAVRQIIWVAVLLLTVLPIFTASSFTTPVFAAPSFTATLDRSTITAGEAAVLSLTFSGGSPSGPPAMPAQPNLVVQYAGEVTQFTIVNGRRTDALIYNYRIVASQPGDYVIPSIQAVIDNNNYASQPLRLKVLKAASSAGPANEKHAFIRLIVPKNTVYIGEVFPVEIQLYVQNLQDLQMPQLKAEGFTVGTMPQPLRAQSQIGNAIYAVFVFKIVASAAKTGTLSLGPVECSLVLRYRKAPDPRDPLGGFFGGQFELRPATLSSEVQTMEVLPLPDENKPDSFNGAVGQFSMAVSASPTNVFAGDPITMNLRIQGSGTLDALPFPPQSDWREFKTYPPTSKVEITDKEKLGLSGVKTFEQVVIPQHAEVKELPPIAFTFFDPEQKAYRMLKGPAIPISVRANTAAQPQPVVAADPAPQSQESPLARDIVHIKPYFGAVGQIHPPLVRQPWFLALQAVPLFALLSAFIWRKRQEAFANDPRLRRRLRVSQLVRKGLAELHTLAAANQAEDFFAAVFRLLQEQLGERLDLPASSITEAVVDERLRSRGAPEELIHHLHELFVLCNQARYAPQRTPRELMSIVPRVELALKGLMELKDEIVR